ncbi:condensation domain-containing protein [Sphingobacterium faecium]|uniref:condensation domain-containing protein n=1 Tax=Sphingobacterium faecium TaxID=34087 RepID=UPI0032088F96
MEQILKKLQRFNINIKLIDGKLCLDVPKGFNAESIFEEVKANREELISHLKRKVKEDKHPRYKFRSEDYDFHLYQNDLKYYEVFCQQEKEYIRYKIIGKFDNNIAFTMAFDEIDFSIIERTLITIFERHESLRTQYKFVNEVPMQYILDDFKVPFVFHDLTDSNHIELSLKEIFRDATGKSFDLENELPASITLVKYSSKNSTLIFTIHHSSSDYNSIAILKEEIAELYAAYKTNRDNALGELKTQYRHYACWVNSLINNEHGISMKNEYLSKIKCSILESSLENLAGFLKTTGIGYRERLYNELKQYKINGQSVIGKRAFGKIVNLIPERGGIYSVTIDVELFKRLEGSAAVYGVSPFIILLATLVLTFYRFSKRRFTRVYVPFSTRVIEDFESIVGWLTSEVILCLEVPSNFSLKYFIKYVAKEFFASSEYRFYPHEEILNDLDVDLDMLVPIYFNYIRYSGHSVGDFYEGHKEDRSHFNMGITISEYENRILMEIRYNLKTYSENNIEKFISLYKESLCQMVSN